MHFFLFAVAHFFAVLSPGPTFIGMTNFAVQNGFKSTLPFLFGIGLGNLIFAFVSMFGLSEIIFKIKLLNIIFYFAGGLYLSFFGIKMFLEKRAEQAAEIKITKNKAFLIGFGIEIANPKSILFTTSLIALFITPESSFFMKMFAIAWLVFVSFIYEIIIIGLFSIFRSTLIKYLHHLKKIFGVALIFFGLRLVYAGFALFLS